MANESEVDSNSLVSGASDGINIVENLESNYGYETHCRWDIITQLFKSSNREVELSLLAIMRFGVRIAAGLRKS